jgi:integrase
VNLHIANCFLTGLRAEKKQQLGWKEIQFKALQKQINKTASSPVKKRIGHKNQRAGRSRPFSTY